MTYTHDEILDRVHRAMDSMSGDEIAELVNREFGMDVTYIGDSMFECLQDSEEEE